ncbi:MAG: autotransporter outer membrane beta-barrel domain-containing protein [Pseudomonadota bacterium]
MKNFYLALCLLFISQSVLAQVPGKPEIDTEYRTYSDAIIGLLDPLRANTFCPGLPSSSVVSGDEDGFNQLSQDLQRVCTSIPNGSSGGTLSGGFAEPFSTRTFLPFTVDSTRPTPPTPSDSPTNSSQAGQLAFSILPTGNEPGYYSGVFSGYEYWVAFGLEAVSYRVNSSDFETGRSGAGFRGDFALGRQFTNGSVLGIGISYEKINTDLSQNPFLFEESSASRSPSSIAIALANVENFCRNLVRGEEDFETFEAHAFYAGNLSQSTTFQVFGGVRHTKSDVTSPLCIYQINDTVGQDSVFASYLSGSPEVVTASLGARAERRWVAGNTLLLLRAGAEAQNRWLDGYTQNEVPVDASSPPINENGNPISVFNTGLALKYEDRDVFTVTTELGLRSVWEFGGPRNPGAYWIDASYQYVFGDTDERVSASFAGDGRAVPTRFTFRGNPIQEHRITVGTGIDYFISEQLATSLFVSGSFTDLTESYRVGASLNWQF